MSEQQLELPHIQDHLEKMSEKLHAAYGTSSFPQELTTFVKSLSKHILKRLTITSDGLELTEDQAIGFSMAKTVHDLNVDDVKKELGI